MTQFVLCRFRAWDARTYAYRNEGDRLEVGDLVEVAVVGGTAEVEVVGFEPHPPPFICKPVLRKVTQP